MLQPVLPEAGPRPSEDSAAREAGGPCRDSDIDVTYRVDPKEGVPYVVTAADPKEGMPYVITATRIQRKSS